MQSKAFDKSVKRVPAQVTGHWPRLGLGFGSRLGLVLGSGATRQLPPRKIDTRLGFGLGLVLGLGGQFSSGEIGLEPPV